MMGHSPPIGEEKKILASVSAGAIKLCELLDQRQFLPFFPMLKDREKRIEQDEIWKKICEELDWEFIPTI